LQFNSSQCYHSPFASVSETLHTAWLSVCGFFSGFLCSPLQHSSRLTFALCRFANVDNHHYPPDGLELLERCLKVTSRPTFIVCICSLSARVFHECHSHADVVYYVAQQLC